VVGRSLYQTVAFGWILVGVVAVKSGELLERVVVVLAAITGKTVTVAIRAVVFCRPNRNHVHRDLVLSELDVFKFVGEFGTSPLDQVLPVVAHKAAAGDFDKRPPQAR
jgi:hypothetical protein